MATCSCSTLLASAKCICVSGKQLLVLQTSLMAKWLVTLSASADVTPATLLASAKCYACMGDAQLQAQIVSNLAGKLTGTAPSATCFNCLPLSQLWLAKANLLCSLFNNATTDPVTPAALTTNNCFVELPPAQLRLAITQMLLNIINATTTYTVQQAMNDAKCFECLSVKQLTMIQVQLSLLIGAASSFTPTQLTGLKLWVDANTLAFSNGADVTLWPDLSGNANHFVQDLPLGAPPKMKSNVAGIFKAGNKAVDAFGFDCLLATTVPLTAQPFSLFMAINVEGKGAADQVWLGNDNVAFYSTSSIAQSLAFFTGPGTDTATGTAVWIAGAPNVFGLTINGAGGSFYVNGVLKANTLNANSGQGWITSSALLNAFISGGVASLFSGGYYGEVIFYNRQLSSTEAGQVNTYLVNKWVS